jgi:hypothetical protein
MSSERVSRRCLRRLTSGHSRPAAASRLQISISGIFSHGQRAAVSHSRTASHVTASVWRDEAQCPRCCALLSGSLDSLSSGIAQNTLSTEVISALTLFRDFQPVFGGQFSQSLLCVPRSE